MTTFEKEVEHYLVSYICGGNLAMNKQYEIHNKDLFDCAYIKK